MLRLHDSEKILEIGVHDLISAGPKEGHLRLSVAWSARTRMKAGQEVHTAWQAERAAEDDAFRAEVTLKRRVVVRGWECRIQGRVDGLSQEGGRTVVEEVKSTTLPAELLMGRTVADFPDYARQLRLYLWFLAGEGIDAVGRLVLVSILDGSRRVLHVDADPTLGDWVTAQLDWLLHEHEDAQAWRARRRAAPVPFPHDRWRPGQEALAADVERSLRAGRRLIMEAPTGYGKTAAALHAALTVARDTGQRVFFATARTTQQRMAEDTVREMVRRGLPIRAVTLRAREKACLNDVVACRPDACSYAEAYHDKLRDNDLLQRLWQQGAGPGLPGVPTPVTVSEVGARFTACPFALSLDLVRSADLVIGDLNYAFDPAVRLAEVGEQPDQWLVIVDEAHNLPARALDAASPLLLLSMAETAASVLRSGAQAARQAPFAQHAEDVADWLRQGTARVPREARDREVALSVGEGVDRRGLDALAQRAEALALDYALLKLQVAPFPAGTPDLWMELARSLMRARGAAKAAGDETLAIWRASRRRRTAAATTAQGSLFTRAPARLSDERAGLKLVCRDAAKILGPMFKHLGGAVCMSATLSPPDFYARVLGIPEDQQDRVEHGSPFPPENRRVLVCPGVSTEYRHRDRDRATTAALVSEALGAIPGNAAVFCPSFAFLESLEPLLTVGDRPVLRQQRGMSEPDRAAILDTMGRGEGHVLLGVLGGIFAEGVDLPGEALLGAIIVGPALPMANLERRKLQDWYQIQYSEGFRYAWLVPGMARVVQAAGRVVRTEDDVGAVVLIGRRFVRREFADMIPAEWSPVRSHSPGADLLGHWARDPDPQR